MKEQTYGWYPSMKDVYTERRLGAPTAYELEAMYKYRDSKYYTAPSPPTQEIQIHHRHMPTTTKRPGSTMSSRSSKSGYDEELQVRAKSAPIAAFKPIPKLILPTPQQCWATKLPETEYGVIPSPSPSVEYTPKSIPVSPEVCVKPTPPPTSPEPASLSRSDSRRERVKSAVIRRDKPTPPPRPVKSAGPSRTPSSASTSIPVKDTGRPSSSSSDKYRPVNPVSKINIDQSIPEEVLSPDGEYDYDKNVQKYGWRMEVHGDPYKLKKVTKRLPYYVKCSAPELKDAPPSVHMENMETFFYNTIPRRPMAYSVHKEWISEVIHAKRLELQKREGIKYRWKNFSFVY